MAEKSTEGQEVPKGLQWDADSPATQTIYANQSNILVGTSDIVMYFGTEPLDTTIPIVPSIRIMLTHASFMVMMEFWAARYYLLRNLYDGAPASLRSLDPNIVAEEFRKMLSPPVDTGEEVKNDG